jgi:arylsulfatase A-like enzyme
MLDPVRYYGFTYAEDGQVRTLDDDRAHYATKVFNREAVRTIRQLGSRPLFMVVDQLAPHRWPGPVGKVAGCPPAAPEPAPRDGDLFAHHRLPRPPSFNEPDVADKPSFIRDRPQFDRSEIDAIRTGYRCGLASLRAVDRGVGQIWRELGKAGERRNTAIIFTSDNGFLLRRAPDQRRQGDPLPRKCRGPAGDSAAAEHVGSRQEGRQSGPPARRQCRSSGIDSGSRRS